ncbi:MAG: LamG domain-containing protein [Alphaproteobacteria bacterium]|nr:LamG domain-containing protein [Alphaproteobacteria bacterium]
MKWSANVMRSLAGARDDGGGRLASIFLLLPVLCLLVPGSARAVCTAPDGEAGTVIYNTNEHVPQYCDGTNWIAFVSQAGNGFSASDPTGNLVGRWELNEASGTSAPDSSGSNNGTLENMDPATDWVSGRVGNALDFDGTGEYVRVGDDPAHNFGTGSFSVAAWVNPRSLPTTQFSGLGGIVAKKNVNGGAGWEFALSDTGSLRAWARVNGGAFAGIYTVNTLTLGKWHHVAMVVDRAENLIKVFIDGVQDTQTIDISGWGSIDVSDNYDLLIGGIRSDLSFLDGQVDDVRVYDTALTPAAIGSLYAAGGCLNPVGAEGTLVFNDDLNVMQYCEGDAWVSVGTCSDYGIGNIVHLPIDEGSGTTAADISGNGYDGTLNNGPLWTTTAITDGQALDFDSTNDYVEIDAGTSLDSLGAITMSAWIRPESAGEGGSAWVMGRDGTINIATLDTGSKIGVRVSRWNTTPGLWSTTNSVLSPYGNWLHVAATYSFTSIANVPDLYVNGERVQVNETQAPVGSLSADSGMWYVGSNSPAATFTFDGQIDDVKIYDKILGADEIDQMYQDGLRARMETAKIGHWPLDETSGTTAADISGNGNDGSLQGGIDASTDFVVGKTGRAASLDSAGEYIQVAGQLGNPPNITIAAWVMYEGSDDQNQPVSIGDHVGLNIDWSASGIPTQGFYNGVGGVWRRTGSTTEIGGSGWNHVVYTIDDSNDVQKFYLNGALADTTNYTESIDYSTARNTHIGKEGLTSSNWQFEGKIDDVRIYDRVLTADEVSVLYNDSAPGYGCTTPGKTVWNTDHGMLQYCDGAKWVAVGQDCAVAASGLVGHWRFDETSGTTAADATTYGNNGTLNNFPADPWDETGGVFDGALVFDGTNDYINLGLPASLDLTGGEVTIAAWIRPDTTSGLRRIVSAPANENSGRERYGLLLNSNALQMWINNQTADYSASVAYTDTTNWHHVAGVFSGGIIRLYVDAVEVTSRDIGGTIADNANATDYVQIGRYGPNFGQYFDGRMDDVRVYNRGLSAAEIEALYSMGAP